MFAPVTVIVADVANSLSDSLSNALITYVPLGTHLNSYFPSSYELT